MTVRFLSQLLYLTEHVHQPAIDPASACHHAVTGELYERQQMFKTSKNQSRRLEDRGVTTGHHLVPVLVHAKVGAAVLHEHVRLHEGVLVQQKLHSLPGCQLTLKEIVIHHRLPCF